jgi:predicted PurR-regulated permease PerM
MKEPSGLSEKFGLWALVATVMGLGILLYKIIEPFLIPLFFAAMLALLCRPLFDRVVVWVGGRHRAAAAMTALTLLALLFPLGGGLFLAGRELASIGEAILDIDFQEEPLVKDATKYLRSQLSEDEWEQLQESVRSGIQDVTTGIFERTRAFLSNVINFLLGFVIMGLALFFFFADGPDILRTLRAVSPLEDQDEEVVFEKFASICRAVILGSLACALVQATLLGIGLAIVGIEGVWLLSGLTFLFSMVPFLGSAAVWIPVTIWLVSAGKYGSAVFLGIYGAAIVSTSDNIVRAYILHESSKMHPLVALISVIGAIKLVGMWGIFLGPLIAALFYSLLKLLNTRLLDQEGSPSESGKLSKPD